MALTEEEIKEIAKEVAGKCIPCECAYDVVSLVSARDHAEAAIIAVMTGKNPWLEMRGNLSAPPDPEHIEALKKRFEPVNALSELNKAVVVAIDGPCKFAPMYRRRGTSLVQYTEHAKGMVERGHYEAALVILDEMIDALWDNSSDLCRGEAK